MGFYCGKMLAMQCGPDGDIEIIRARYTYNLYAISVRLSHVSYHVERLIQFLEWISLDTYID